MSASEMIHDRDQINLRNKRDKRYRNELTNKNVNR
jgi:hypothetical protein